MIPSEEFRPAFSSSVIDLRAIPLAEMAALGASVLGGALDRVLPAAATSPVPVAAFQSSI
jgi:FXSXX-COOH protein